MKTTALIAASLFVGLAGLCHGKDHLITTYGARADGKSNNASFIQKAIDTASADGGGRVIVPPGNFVSGTLVLKSGVTLFLEQGACLLGSVNRMDYKGAIALGLVTAQGQKNIAIAGTGVIDGRAGELVRDIIARLRSGEITDREGWETSRPSEGVRPMLVLLKDCEQVFVSEVTLKNAACWVQNYVNCTNLVIAGIKVESTAYWNNDGIDISDCQNVTVTNCFVNAADDGICLKSETPGKSCDQVYVGNCTIRSSASGFKMGTASHGGFKNIVLRDLTIYDTYRSAIAIESVDGGHIENVDIRHVAVTNAGNTIFIRLGHRNQKAEAGTVKGIHIADVKAVIPFAKPDQGYPLEGPPDNVRPWGQKLPQRRFSYPFYGHPWLPYNMIPSSIVGIPGHKVSGVVLENIEITYAGGADKNIACITPENITSVPECERDYPEFSMFGELPAWGFYVRHAENIQFRNVKIQYQKEDFRPALVFDDVNGVHLKSMEISSASEMPVVLLNKVTDEQLDGLKMPVDASKGIQRMSR